MFIDFRERGREREREKHQRERETLIGCLPHMPHLGTEPATSVCALTGHHTPNRLVYRTMLQPTEPPGQGKNHNEILKP